MLVIRLFRTGKKNQPSFKIVVTDKRRSAKKGRSVEEVGLWDPIKKVKTLKGDRIKYWLSVGAKASDTVHNFLVQEKIIEGKKIAVHPVRKIKNKEEVKVQSDVVVEPINKEVFLESELSNGVNNKVAKEAVEAVPVAEEVKKEETIQEKPAEESKKENVSSEAATETEVKEKKPEEKSTEEVAKEKTPTDETKEV